MVLGIYANAQAQFGIGAGLDIGSHSAFNASFIVKGQQVGVIADLGFGFRNTAYGEDYTETISHNQFNDPYRGETYKSGLNFKGGLIFNVGDRVYVGGGIRTQTTYTYMQLFDPMYILSSDGDYYFETGSYQSTSLASGS